MGLRSQRIPGLNGVPGCVEAYYRANGLPAEVISCRETNSPKDSTSYISIQFKGHSFRHRWNDGNKASQFSKIKTEGWTLDIIPI